MIRKTTFQWFSFLNLALLLALVKFILPFCIQDPVYEPHRDEYLYLAEAHHLAWGYLEVPPLMSILACLTNAMGGTLFWIKSWPSLFGSLTFLLVARLIFLMGGRGFALVLGFLPFIFGYLLHVHFMFQPNFLEVFFWTLMAYGLIIHLETQSAKGLYIAGVAFGLGMMSKYSVAFFGLSLFLGLLLTKERSIFSNKHFYFALLLGLLIFLPNLIWQFDHGLPIVYHMKELQEQQLQRVSRADFLTDQLLFNLPCVFVWMAGLHWVCFTTKGTSFRFIGWAIGLVMAFLALAHGKSYYAMGAYPILFPFGAVFIERRTSQTLRPLRFAMIVFILCVGCFMDTVTIPFLPPRLLAAYYQRHNIFRKMGFLKWEDQKDHPLPQDFADMLSWKEMTEKIARIYQSLDSSQKRQTVIDADNYGEIGAVNYYGPGYALPTAMGHSASFLFWVPPDFFKSNIVILATDSRIVMQEAYVKEFKSSSIKDSITNPFARELGSYIILLKGPSEKFRKDWLAYYESLRRETSFFR
jgi:hypothetical protein